MISPTLYTSRTDEWATPQNFFDKLNEEFHFTLDPCASTENHKCDKYYTKEQNGLSFDWGKEVVFCNPPYGKEIKYWCEKAYRSSLGGGNGSIPCPFTHRHTLVSRLGIRQSRTPLHKRSIKVWWFKQLCTIPVFGSYL